MKKGFTLVELIAVITIMSLIAIIAGVSYTTVNNNHKKNACNALKGRLENTAIEYVQDKKLLHQQQSTYDGYCSCDGNVSGDCICVYYNQISKSHDLSTKGYLEAGLKNPINDTNLVNVGIRVTRAPNSNTYSATVYAGLACE